MKKWKQLTTTIILLLTIIVVTVQPVYAAKKFKGWNKTNQRDAWDVYSMTDWRPFAKEMNFGQAKSTAKAQNISKDIEARREQVKKILMGMNQKYGIYPNEEYTELILCMVHVLCNGTLDPKDPGKVCVYISPDIPPASMTFEKSIQTLFKRLSAAESLNREANIYDNNAKLQSVIQGVLFTPNYTKRNKEYTLDNAKKYKEEFPNGLHGNPPSDFAQKVAKHYQCTKVNGGMGGSLVVGNGTFTHPCPESTISSPYGPRGGGEFHKGVDFAAPSGRPTYAAADGIVLVAGWSDTAGNWVVIHHGNNLITKYMHHSAIYVQAGQQVKKGQQIGAVGNTGQSFGAHLHFQVDKNANLSSCQGTAVDPMIYFK